MLKPGMMCFIKGFTPGQLGFPFNGHIVELVGKTPTKFQGQAELGVSWTTRPAKIHPQDGVKVGFGDANLHPLNPGPMDDVDLYSEKPLAIDKPKAKGKLNEFLSPINSPS